MEYKQQKDEIILTGEQFEYLNKKLMIHNTYDNLVYNTDFTAFKIIRI